MSEISREAGKVIRKITQGSDETSEVRVHNDETRETKTPGFSRMRTEWNAQDAGQIRQLRTTVEGTILRLFPEAFVLMNDIYDLVREKVVDENGVIEEDAFGFPLWAKNHVGGYIEDFTLLNSRQREDFLFRITTNLFEWRQTSTDLWGEAMLAKAQWEEALAMGYDSSAGKTVEDRTQKGRLYSTDERYFAIFLSMISRKADSVVDSMELLGLRLSQSLN